jgi:zinc and cadmium transporter
VDPLILLLLYGVGLTIFSLAGGGITERLEMTHTRTQLAMSLVSGLMLGIALFHLLPHAVLTIGVAQGLNSVMGWVAMGLVTMLLLLRLFHFHQPDFHHAQEHGHSHGHCDQEEAHANWRGVLIGLSFHTVVDGVALGAALLGAPHGHAEDLLGFGVFVAILLHKPLDALAITALMKAGGVGVTGQRAANIAFAMLCPAGALVFYIYASSAPGSAALIAAAMAFSAGAFICIALSDLLPEVQFHSHDRLKLTAVFLFGILLAFTLASASPDHGHELSIAAPPDGHRE